MILSKKWKLYLFGLVLLVSCKSADCGCPMAESPKVNNEKSKEHKTFNKVIVVD